MIKFKLKCRDCDISFDSWFSSSKEYEKLKKKKISELSYLQITES